MRHSEARRLLGLPLEYTKSDIATAFRDTVYRHHMDTGDGDGDMALFVKARDTLMETVVETTKSEAKWKTLK